MIDDTALATKQITSKLDMLEKIVSKKSKRRRRLIKELNDDSKIANREETGSAGGEKKLVNQKTLSRSSSVQSRKRWRKAKMISKIAFLTKSKTGAAVKKASEVTSKVGSRFVSTITVCLFVRTKQEYFYIFSPGCRLVERVWTRSSSIPHHLQGISHLKADLLL